MRLNTLGGIRVLADGNLVSGSAAQPRRLAVLALLARAGRAGVTREKIMALLWPDEPDERARRSLNQAVYSLRRDLGGEDTLLGSKDLRLNLERIEVDTIEFDDAVQLGDVERALRIYAGPFLDGLHVPRAPEFDRWIEAERAALAQEYAVLLERAAATATRKGEHAAAVGHLRKLAAADPLNARIALSLMHSLVAVGDAAGAIQHARLHEALLEQELGLPPDRDVAALSRQLRTRSAPTPEPAEAAPAVVDAAERREKTEAAGFEPVAAPVPTPTPLVEPSAAPIASGLPNARRRWWILGAMAAVVVAAIAVRAISHGSVLRSSKQPVVAVGTINDYANRDSVSVAKALRDMLATNLARSPDLIVVSASRLLEVERQVNGDSPTPTATIVPVARQAGATALVDGALYKLGTDSLRLDLRLTNLQNGNVLRAYSVTGRDPFALADSATSQLVSYLGYTPPAGSVADATTRSVTAYRLYEEGLRSYYLGDMTSSGRLLEAALAADSTFAMAAYYYALSSRSTRAEIVRRFRRAVALAKRASDRERLIIEGGWAETNNLVTLKAIAETLATRYPTEVEGHYYLGRALVNGGSYIEAIAPLHRVEIMDSLSLRDGDPRCVACDALQQQVAAYVLADSGAAAERVARRYIAARPKEWIAYLMLGRILGSVGRSDEALAAFRAADSLDARGSHWEPISTVWTHDGDFARADQLIRSEIAKGDDPVNGHWFLAISLRYQGRFNEALGEARAFRRGGLGPDKVAPGAADLSALLEAQVLRELGRYREAAALFDSVSRFSVVGADSSADRSGRVWSLTHEAGALAAGGDTSRLAALADTIEAYGAISNRARDNRMHHHVRGLLLAARGDDAGAAAEFQRAIFSVTLGYTRTSVDLAKVLIRLRRYGEAVSILEPATRGSLEAANLYATYPEIKLLLAEAYAGSGQREKAGKELDWVRRAWVNADANVRPRLADAERRVAGLR